MKSIRTNIYRRTYGENGVSWMVRWKDQKTGRWKSFTAGKTKDEALIAEAQVRQDLLKGIDPSPADPSRIENPTVAVVAEAFFRHPKFMTGDPGWQKEVKGKIQREVLPKLGKVRFAELNAHRVYQFYLALRERDLANATIHKYHAVLCSLGDVFEEQRPGNENPVRKLRDFKKRFPLQASTRDINFLTPEELELLFDEVEQSKAPLLSAFVRFQANTGLRRSETLRLKWTDIDEKAGFIHVRKSKNGKARTIPLEPKALEAICDFSRRHEFVFTYRDGTRPHRDSFLKPMKAAAERCKIRKRIDIHTLRHSFGSNKIRMGWGLKKVSMILGHSDISITARVYTHLLDGDLKVRDDFHFDNGTAMENSGLQGNSLESMSQLLTQFITALQKSEVSEEKLAEKVKDAVSALSIDNDLGPSGVISTNSTRTGKSDSLATQMLHTLEKKTHESLPAFFSKPEFRNLFNDLLVIRKPSSQGAHFTRRPSPHRT